MARYGAFFGRRKGKTLRGAQRLTLESRLPELLIDLSEPAPEPLAKLFAAPVGDVRLEIGFGGGEHLLHEARSNPAIGFIGIEPFENGLAKAVSELARDPLPNIRLFNQDAIFLLDWLPRGALARIDLLYPDPWPKRRHAKRRFVNGQNLDRIARALRDGGSFRLATDVEPYGTRALEVIERHGGFAAEQHTLAEARDPWPGWPGTRYEAKALAEGRRPAYLGFRRRPGWKPPPTHAEVEGPVS